MATVARKNFLLRQKPRAEPGSMVGGHLPRPVGLKRGREGERGETQRCSNNRKSTDNNKLHSNDNIDINKTENSNNININVNMVENNCISGSRAGPRQQVVRSNDPQQRPSGKTLRKAQELRRRYKVSNLH